MRMRSGQLGKSISAVEVTNVSQHGFWLLLEGRELFLPFEQCPWFRHVSIGQLLNVHLLNPRHLYWPELDVDLAVESIEHPERYPLISKQRPNPGISRPATKSSGGR